MKKMIAQALQLQDSRSAEITIITSLVGIIYGVISLSELLSLHVHVAVNNFLSKMIYCSLDFRS